MEYFITVHLETEETMEKEKFISAVESQGYTVIGIPGKTKIKENEDITGNKERKKAWMKHIKQILDTWS